MTPQVVSGSTNQEWVNVAGVYQEIVRALNYNSRNLKALNEVSKTRDKVPEVLNVVPIIKGP